MIITPGISGALLSSSGAKYTPPTPWQLAAVAASHAAARTNAHNQSLNFFNSAFTRGALSSATLAAVQQILGFNSEEAYTYHPYSLAVGQTLSNFGINPFFQATNSNDQFSLTLSSQGGTLGVPSTTSSGTVVQLIGTAEQISNTLKDLTFTATDVGSGSVAVTGLTNDTTGAAVTSDGGLFTEINVSAQPIAATLGVTKTAPAGGQLVVSGVDTNSTDAAAAGQSLYMADGISTNFTKFRGYAVAGGSGNNYTATLDIQNGQAQVTAAGAAVVNITNTGPSSTTTITGTLDDVNATLASLEARGTGTGNGMSQSTMTLIKFTATDGSQTAFTQQGFSTDLYIPGSLFTSNVAALTRQAQAGEVIDASGFKVNALNDLGQIYTAHLSTNGSGTLALGDGARSYQLDVTGDLTSINAQLDTLNFQSLNGGGSISLRTTVPDGNTTNYYGLKNIIYTGFTA